MQTDESRFVVVVCAVGMPNRQTSPRNHSHRPPFLQPSRPAACSLSHLLSVPPRIPFLSPFLPPFPPSPRASSLYVYVCVYIYIFLLRGFSSIIVRLFLYLHFLPARYLPPRFPSLLLSASLYLQSFLILLLPYPFLRAKVRNTFPSSVISCRPFCVTSTLSRFPFILFSSSCLLASFFFWSSIVAAFLPLFLLLRF